MKLISNNSILCTQDGMTVSYKRGKVYFEEGGTIHFVASLMDSKLKQILIKFPLVERALRFEPKLAVLSGKECILSHHGSIYKCDLENHFFEKEHCYRKKMNNPVKFGEVEGIEGFNDGLLYGEYWGNTDREKVNIYQRGAEGWKIKYTFPEGTITHIHGFVCDKNKKRILILTGDFDEGSGIWVTTDDFKTVNPLLVGKQQYRSCVAFSCDDGILYATDTPLEENAIYFFDEKNGQLNKIQSIPGPCIYGREYMDENGCKQYVFATSVEPDSTITGWRYLLTYRLGKGVKDRRTHVLAGNEKSGFHEILSLKKDWLPMGLFQFGNIRFPSSEDVVCVPQAVRKCSGKTFRLFE